MADRDRRVRAAPQMPLGITLADHSGFTNFHAGADLTAVRAVQALAAGDDDGILYLAGPRGTGKSHLLQAACRQATESGERAAYVPLSQVLDPGPGVLEGLESLDLVALDELEAVAGRRDWESALFNLVREAIDRRQRLLVAGNASPGALDWQLPDLASRLASGPVFRLHSLDDQGLLDALTLRARHRGLELPPEAARYLLRRQSREPATLFALLDELDVASLAAQRRLTIPFLREVLSD